MESLLPPVPGLRVLLLLLLLPVLKPELLSSADFGLKQKQEDIMKVGCDVGWVSP